MKALHAGKHQVKLLARERLLQKIHGSAPHGLHRVFHTALRRKDDHRQIGLELVNLLQDVETLFRPKINIQKDRIELSFP